MSNKKKRTQNGAPKPQISLATSKGKSGILTVGLTVAVAATGGIYYVTRPSAASTPVSQVQTVSYRRRETRPTLSPALFTGEVASAYQVARDIPDVLDQLYCYCQCEENFGHKSLLSCYVDRHAST